MRDFLLILSGFIPALCILIITEYFQNKRENNRILLNKYEDTRTNLDAHRKRVATFTDFLLESFEEIKIYDIRIRFKNDFKYQKEDMYLELGTIDTIAYYDESYTEYCTDFVNISDKVIDETEKLLNKLKESDEREIEAFQDLLDKYYDTQNALYKKLSESIKSTSRLTFDRFWK